MRDFMRLYGRDICNILIGAIIAWGMSYIYYVKAGKELAEETQRLRTLHNTTLLALQNLQNKNVAIQLEPDERGDLTKMGVHVTVPAPQATTQTAEAAATK